MTLLWNDPAQFADEAVRGFVEAYPDQVSLVPGGVVRATQTRPGKVAVVVGGGSGHYPAFCGLVGEGFADGAVIGNVFTSPSTDDVVSVCRNAAADAGVVMLTGNYAGDVMNFSLAAQRMATEGIDARYVLVTDDIASAPVGEEDQRRGIAGDLAVFKVAAAAAEAGADLDEVERLARHANDRTRTLGVAFDGCTLPGADSPLFTVPDGRMGIGVGIHGEPGIGETAMPTAADLATTLVEAVLAEAPGTGPSRAAVILNGLGRTKYEELFVLWATAAPLLREAGVTIVEPDVGELVTSLDMAGCSLTLMWLDKELEPLWCAPSAAPAYRKGHVVPAHPRPAGAGSEAVPRRVWTPTGAPAPEKTAAPVSPWARTVAGHLVEALGAATAAVRAVEEDLGRLDAVAGDGDHGRGMVRGLSAAEQAGRETHESGGGPGDVLASAGRAWAGKAGGTSGVLWGAMLEAAGTVVREEEATHSGWQTGPTQLVADAVGAAVEAVTSLGKASAGDKTMLDALLPLHRSLLEAGDASPVAAWSAAAQAATRAAEETATLRPRVGRARPLAEQSVGHRDPGAVSLALVARTVPGVFDPDAVLDPTAVLHSNETSNPKEA